MRSIFVVVVVDVVVVSLSLALGLPVQPECFVASVLMDLISILTPPPPADPIIEDSFGIL